MVAKSKRLFEFRRRVKEFRGGRKIRAELFRNTKPHFRQVQRQVDLKQFEKGFFGSFRKNPIGTMASIFLFFMALYWAGQTGGPFAGNASLIADMNAMYANSSWVGLLSFAFLPLAIGYSFIPIVRARRQSEAMVPVEQEQEQVEESPE